jgi:ribosome-binding factor A
MKFNRTDRLNSLLKEVISEVILKNIRNPKISKFTSITAVKITPDLHYAKVDVSIIGAEEEKRQTIKELNKAAGFIATKASKKVVMHHFPALSFQLDNTVEKHMQIEKIIQEIHKEQEERTVKEDDE